MSVREGGVQLTMFDRASWSPTARFERPGRAAPRAPSITIEMEYDGSTWSPREMEAWAPPQDILVSEWAEKNRILPARQSASPGPWTNKAYYTVDVMDAFLDPFVERITILASVQSSKTESIYNMLGYATCEDPGPALVVMPTDKTLKRVSKRIKMMIQESPAMRKHETSNPDDMTKHEISLDNMTVSFATAGSSADLRNLEVRYLLIDEIDDYPAYIEGQGSPIAMAEDRTTTYWNRKIIKCCTATSVDGYIDIEYKASNKMKYWVPCPHCRGYQILSFWRIKHKGEKLGEWPKDKRDKEYVKRERVARYECEHCGEEIDDRDKAWMLLYGTWVPEGHEIDKDGSVAIPRRLPSHVGFWWNALYSPWRTFSEIAAQFWGCKDDKEKYKVFTTLWLAEPWKDTIVKTSESKILGSIAGDCRPQIVPSAAVALTAFVDCQLYGFWFTVRAWAKDYTSWNIHYGQLSTWDEVENLLFETFYPIDGSDQVMRIWRAGVDIGGTKGKTNASMTEQAELWIGRNGAGRGCRVWACKGSSGELSGKLKIGRPRYKTPSGKPLPGGLQVISIDTNRVKDAFHMRLQLAIERKMGGSYLYAPPEGDENHHNTYVSHLLAEEKRRTTKGVEEWVQLKPRNDLFDCECGCLVLADPEWPGGGVNLIRTESDEDETPRNDQQRKPNPFTRRY